MSDPFSLSRKIQKSIFDGIEILRFGPFTERDVKALLVDLRELARYMVGAPATKSVEVAKMINEFIDVCDFIAHSSRDRGVVEKTVRTHVRTLRARLGLAQEESAKIPVPDFLDTNRLVAALAAISAFALSSLGPKSRDDCAELLQRNSEIALCILSLLQDTRISLRGDEGDCFLQLMPYEKKYRLYGCVMDPKKEREEKALAGGEMRVLKFPVAISNAECVDQDILSCDHDAFPAKIFETFRHENSSLQLRVVEMIGNKIKMPSYRR